MPMCFRCSGRTSSILRVDSSDTPAFRCTSKNCFGTDSDPDIGTSLSANHGKSALLHPCEHWRIPCILLSHRGRLLGGSKFQNTGSLYDHSYTCISYVVLTLLSAYRFASHHWPSLASLTFFSAFAASLAGFQLPA